MKKKLFVMLVVIMIVSAVAIPVLAGSRDNASGEWYYRPTTWPPAVMEVVGGNTIISSEDEGYFTGTIAGDEQDSGWVVINKNGHWLYWGKVSFASATVDGKTGGLEIRVHGWRPDAEAPWDGTWHITGGTGDLAGLRGGGTWSGMGWLGDPAEYGVVEYSGNIHMPRSRW